MKKTLQVIMALILLAAVVHIALGVWSLFSGNLALNTLWFISGGLALVFIVFINYLIINMKPHKARFYAIGHITNILGSILMAAILCFLTAPHVALLLLLLLAETMLLFWSDRTTARVTL